MDNQMKRYLGQALGGPKCRNFCTHGLGVCHPPGVNVFTSQETLYGCTIGILWRFPHVGVVNYQLHVQPLPSLEDGKGRGQNLQPSNDGFIFLVTSLHPEVLQESPQQNKRCSQCSYHENLLGFYELCQGRIKDIYQNKISSW